MAWVAEEFVWQTTSFAALHLHHQGFNGCWSDVVALCPPQEAHFNNDHAGMTPSIAMVQVEWNNPDDPTRGHKYLYLSDEDYMAISKRSSAPVVRATLVASQNGADFCCGLAKLWMASHNFALAHKIVVIPREQV